MCALQERKQQAINIKLEEENKKKGFPGREDWTAAKFDACFLCSKTKGFSFFPLPMSRDDERIQI